MHYSIRVRPGLRGRLEYTAIEPGRVDIVWQVPGLRENGTWAMRRHGAGTLVQHTCEHAGPLATALRQAYRGAGRLAQQLARTDTAS